VVKEPNWIPDYLEDGDIRSENGHVSVPGMDREQHVISPRSLYGLLELDRVALLQRADGDGNGP
jgi:hypothetical protein